MAVEADGGFGRRGGSRPTAGSLVVKEVGPAIWIYLGSFVVLGLGGITAYIGILHDLCAVAA